MRVTYCGPHSAVVVPLPGGGELVVGRGDDTPELDALFAASLLTQPSNWKPYRPRAERPISKKEK